MFVDTDSLGDRVYHLVVFRVLRQLEHKSSIVRYVLITEKYLYPVL